MEINSALQGTDNTLIIVRRDDLIEFAKTYAKKTNESKPEPEKGRQSETPISQPEAVKFLGKSRQTFHSWRKKGIVKAHILGGRVYYFKSELLSAMK
jgi:hypothetical protein